MPWLWHMEMANILGLKLRDGNPAVRDIEKTGKLLALLKLKFDLVSQQFTDVDILSVMPRFGLPDMTRLMWTLR